MNKSDLKNIKIGDWVRVQYEDNAPFYGELDDLQIMVLDEVEICEFIVGGVAYINDPRDIHKQELKIQKIKKPFIEIDLD